MRLSEYRTVDNICDILAKKYNYSPDPDMRTQIRNFVMDIYSGRRAWWEYLVIGKDEEICLTFSSDLRVYVGYCRGRGSWDIWLPDVA